MRYVCPRCIVGTLQPAETTHVRILNARLITTPHFPTWRCDACGHTRYDRAALARLNLLFGDEAFFFGYLANTFTARSRKWAHAPGGPGEHGPHRRPI
jgi:hypothetical protein